MKDPVRCKKRFQGRVAPIALFSLILSKPGYAASPDFQAFLFSACLNASGSLLERCSESINGDLSGDSEDSLNPTQSLSFNAIATDETRARINALQAKLRQNREMKTQGSAHADEQDAMSVFQLTGASALLQGQSTRTDREASEQERGYDSDTHKLQIGFDYRLTNNWLIGAMLTAEETETTFDADKAGVNFEPGANEGGTDSDGYSISFFTSKNLFENLYIESLASYGESKYSFKRSAIFQESTRDPAFNRAVNTEADADGRQYALSIGMGMEQELGMLNLSYYVNLDYQKSSIDSYRETGGEGFAMAVNQSSTEHTTGTLGARLSRSYNTSSGVWVPRVFVELERVLDDEQVQTTSRFIEDLSATPLRTSGDRLDKTHWRTGISLLTVRPNGWMGFISFSSLQGDGLKDQHSVHAGLRIEL